MYTNITENCKNVIARSSRTFAASFVIDEIRYADIKKLTISVPSTANGMATIGGTISNSVEIITEKVNVLRGQKIEVFESVKLDSGEYEDIPMGHFKITSAKTKDSLTTIVASGPLSTEATLGYFSDLEYPATTIQILNEISQFIGVPIEVANLEEIYVESKPEGYTYREVIGFIAAMHVMNAVETRDGTIAFKWYEDSEEDIFTDKTDSPELSNSIFTVNKFECATGSNTWSKGKGSAGIAISNPLMTDAMADYVWEKLSGFSYRPGTFNIKSGTPCVDSWDSFLYNNERVIATELQYVYDGGLQNTYKSSGETETSNSYKGPIAMALERYYAELLIVKDIAADSITVEEADIRYARMDQLDVIEANITSAVIDSIDGRYASIDYIQSNYVSTLGFNALEGRVGILETKALTAESALIKELQSEITKTNTLIFGAAGGSSIQTEFSNSVIAMLGNAQIKSAMIDDVSADKIKSGSLYTNLVHIYGDESNKLSIVDNTIAISDGIRTRVQIGKDASDDYNMYVWDKSGNLMFDALGLTEDGITRQIIRDEVVKDDANINAAKLDIDSLFTEINGSSNTIKSTKVYFDSEKQTLDAVFESMTTTVDGLQSTQRSQGTQISAIQGQISSKIWQEDINTAVNEVEGDVSALSTQYSTLNQTVTGLSSTVGSHTTQINSLDTRVDSAESSITQHAKEIALKVNEDGVIAAINLSSEEALIEAAKINLVGAVTFSSLDSSTQSKINSASSNASNALTTATAADDTANSALSTATTANTNASNAVSTANSAAATANTASTNASNAVSTANSAAATANTANATANNALEAANNATPFIKGTQTAATGAWTGVAPFASLTDGQQITYWLPYAGSGNATLNLTLSTGSTTGAIACYYGGATRLTTHYPAGSAIRLTYRKNVAIGSATYTGWWADANYDSGNTYDRIRYTGTVKASAAIVAGNIIVGDASGYHHLKTGGSFDVSYPILYAAGAIASGGTGNNNYLAIGFSVGTTQSITLTAYKAVYIKGTLNGSKFTPVSTAPLTQTVPASDDGYYYILLGTAYATTAIYLATEHPIYRYKNGAFKTTAQISSEIAAWAWNNDVTYIDGGAIYSKSIKAESIDVEDLFAQDITATNLLITGNSVFEGRLDGATGNFSGDVTAATLSASAYLNGVWSTIDFGYQNEITLQVKDNNQDDPAKHTAQVKLWNWGDLLLSGYKIEYNAYDVHSFYGDIDASGYTITAQTIKTSAGADLDELNSKLSNFTSLPWGDYYEYGRFSVHRISHMTWDDAKTKIRVMIDGSVPAYISVSF